MRVYDWDKTIYDGDSSFDFICYLLFHYHRTCRYLPVMLMYSLAYLLHLVKKQYFKEKIFYIFHYVDNMPQATSLFCQSHLKYIKHFYQQEEDDLIISASPEFLIKEFAKQLGIKNVLASPVDCYSGKYYGFNCHGQEKVKRFYAQYPNGKISVFYSDSLSDSPLARIAKKAYLVKKNKLLTWPK